MRGALLAVFLLPALMACNPPGAAECRSETGELAQATGALQAALNDAQGPYGTVVITADQAEQIRPGMAICMALDAGTVWPQLITREHSAHGAVEIWVWANPNGSSVSFTARNNRVVSVQISGVLPAVSGKILE